MKGEATPMQACVLALALILTGCGDSSSPLSQTHGSPVGESAEADGWIGAWGAAPYGPFPLGSATGFVPVPGDLLTTPAAFTDNQASDQSFRMMVYPTIGGETIRIRLSNLMGDRPVNFDSVHVALRAVGPAVVPASDTPVPFGGKSEVTIPPGAEAVSDPVKFAYSFGDTLAISFHVVGDSGAMTWHGQSFGPNYVGLPNSGDTTADPSGATFMQLSAGWFFISGVDVLAPEGLGTIVAIGDSITDGSYEVPESNTRWPDWFARRLNDAGIAMGVLNEGISSNTVTPARSGAAGAPAVERFERDVLQRPGVRSVVIFEGTNDLSAGVKADELFAALSGLALRAHAARVCVVVGTIMPRGGPIGAQLWDAATQEPERQMLNELIRSSPDFDGVADFDRTMGSPLDPEMLNPLYAFPDGLHPNSLGMKVMADTIPLEVLVPPPVGRCARRSLSAS